jgi:hypothetical protein
MATATISTTKPPIGSSHSRLNHRLCPIRTHPHQSRPRPRCTKNSDDIEVVLELTARHHPES